jgi:transcriptional regulator GlxA family with amidase domain
MTKIAVWALDGGLGSMIAGTVDVFHVANMLWTNRHPDMDAPLFQWHVASPSGLPIRTDSGLTISAQAAIDPRADVDVVFVPGIVATTATDIEAAIERNARLIASLRKQHVRGAVIAANCASTFFLAEAGLLEGRIATTSWWLEDTFRRRYPGVNLRAGEIVTEDDAVMCSGASTACLHLALRLVERFGNVALAAAVTKNLLIDAGRTSQAPFKTLTVQAHLKHSDAIVLRGQRWMEKYLAKPFQLSPLARHLRTSERTVIRRFKQATGRTPGRYMQEMKIEFAKRLLEAGQMSVDKICLRVGYEDVSSFRHLFRRETGVSPSQYQALVARPASRKRGNDRRLMD